ncbi:receptor-like serine threonine-protein kinase [Musa troglodytarum]|uniref:Receptor-like serine threonine-protein kinase n=1 Tax=Musa troglodytarum TaxID=320322 RepID=A0A9E7IHJ7_9LILI|nr:receptor-like serine threonine-protein kinase [Musa troglodytarum]
MSVCCLLKQQSADGIEELGCRETMRNVVVRVCLGFLAAAILVNGQPGTSRGGDHYCRPPPDSLSMCLANLGSGTPFLSLLESRHIDNHLAYQDANQSAALVFYSRCNLGSLTNDTLRVRFRIIYTTFLNYMILDIFNSFIYLYAIDMQTMESDHCNFAFVTMRSSVNSTLFVSFIEIIAPSIQDALAIPETHRFTYDELKAITNNFDLRLGKGGFGNVYHGRLHDGTEAAVKLLHSHRMVKETSSESSMSAINLIGYCRDSNQLGLVYEYAARGSLRDHLSDAFRIFSALSASSSPHRSVQHNILELILRYAELRDHLSDKTGNSQTLSWRERIRIAVEAAQGMEYLHKGCVPPIIHRDVKTNNILLTHDFEAKVADFGLSKPFLTDAQTHVSTDVVVGTPGYVDPQYSATFQLTEKSDVYSFGVVLLELVTGRSAMLDQPKRYHIVQWVRWRVAEADITEVADPKLGARYDNCSILKVIDLAIRCVDISAHQRPTMAEVVMRLKESLQPENNYGSDTNAYMEINDAGNSGMASEAMLARLSR